jgi:hypothetical protein
MDSNIKLEEYYPALIDGFYQETKTLYLLHTYWKLPGIFFADKSQ